MITAAFSSNLTYDPSALLIGFFVLNMILKLWAYTGVYWIIAGLLYGVVIAISKMFIDKE